MFKTILFPIDMSPEAQQAAHLAIDLVKQHQSQLVLLSVVETGDSPEHPEQASREAVAALLNQAHSLFEQQVSGFCINDRTRGATRVCDL